MVARTYIKIPPGTADTDWKQVRAIYVNDGTAWRTVKAQWVKQSPGTSDSDWKLVHRGVFVYNETISTNQANYNLRTKLINSGWDQVQDVEASITVNPGVTIYSTTTGSAAFTISPALPPQSTVTLTNRGVITGKGGDAGNGGGATASAPSVPPSSPPIFQTSSTAENGTIGSPGGTGISITSPMTLINTGTISGGGGGGGGGGGAAAAAYGLGKPAFGTAIGGGGGGGGGGSVDSSSVKGLGGSVSTTSIPSVVLYPGNNGSDGTNAGGAGGASQTRTSIAPPGGTVMTVTSGSGGAGGARGSSGGTGGAGTGSVTPSPFYTITSASSSGASGGSSGAAIVGYPLVTQPPASTGTISGPTPA